MAKPLYKRSKSIVCNLHVFVEELSAKKVLNEIIPKIIPGVSFEIHPHQGKKDLEISLPKTVSAISRIPGCKVLILLDQDMENCLNVKNRLTQAISGKCMSPSLIRIACRELESWFLGDLNAVQSAYPSFNSQQYINKAKFRNVDNIQNPDGLLLKILPDYKGRKSLPKFKVSEKISPSLNIQNNRSTSFKHFVDGLQKLVNCQ